MLPVEWGPYVAPWALPRNGVRRLLSEVMDSPGGQTYKRAAVVGLGTRRFHDRFAL